MDPIESISGTSGTSGAAVQSADSSHALARSVAQRMTQRATATRPVQQTAFEPDRVASAADDGAPALVRPSPIGGDGRFEKFILALQALRLDYGIGAPQTDRTEKMRAAAEELFKIDGTPQAFPPAAAPDAAPDAASEAPLTPAAEETAPAPGPAAAAPGRAASPDAAPAAREPPASVHDDPQA